MDNAADLLDGVADLDMRYFYACVKAEPLTDRERAGGSNVADEGPWVIGRSAGFRRTLGTPSLSVSNSATGLNSGEIRVTVGSVTGATSYVLQQRDTGTDSWSDVSVPDDRIVTVSGTGRQDFQVRAVTEVRGDSLPGKWSSVRLATPKP